MALASSVSAVVSPPCEAAWVWCRLPAGRGVGLGAGCLGSAPRRGFNPLLKGENGRNKKV